MSEIKTNKQITNYNADWRQNETGATDMRNSTLILITEKTSRIGGAETERVGGKQVSGRGIGVCDKVMLGINEGKGMLSKIKNESKEIDAKVEKGEQLL
ncbi:MAG: hypothetical protein LBR91_02775 [Puniceicoccales bacterium]|jgi:hypothetical protein|nr:hypothetical protein [Puniceicoccales bacterium]